MNLNEKAYLITGAVLRLFDVVTDVIYVATQEFGNTSLFSACILFLIVSSVVLSIIFAVSLAMQKKASSQIKIGKESLFYLFIIIGEATGLSLLFAIFFAVKKNPAKKSEFFFIAKMASIVNTFFQSMPQIMLQTYNSGQLELYNGIFIASCTCSGIYILFSFLRLIKIYDRQEKIISTIDMITKTGNVTIEDWKNKDITLEEIVN